MKSVHSFSVVRKQDNRLIWVWDTAKGYSHIIALSRTWATNSDLGYKFRLRLGLQIQIGHGLHTRFHIIIYAYAGGGGRSPTRARTRE